MKLKKKLKLHRHERYHEAKRIHAAMFRDIKPEYVVPFGPSCLNQNIDLWLRMLYHFAHLKFNQVVSREKSSMVNRYKVILENEGEEAAADFYDKAIKAIDKWSAEIDAYDLLRKEKRSESSTKAEATTY